MKVLHLVLALLLVGTPLGRAAVKRAVSIEAPAVAAAGSTVAITVAASTDAGDGEEIGFLEADYSADDGLTWTRGCAVEKGGTEVSRHFSFAVNATGGMAIVRVRAAFRGGATGDVDFRGGAIQWGDTWQKWRWPPAKFAIIRVSGPTVVKRTLSIDAPAEAGAGSRVSVTVLAGTDATDGEQIGFLHADYSIDEGRTWTQFCYAEKPGATLTRKISFAVNATGGKAIVRVRVAFRGGVAGDVDWQGGGIQWGAGWQQWRAPATKYAIIYSPRRSVAAPIVSAKVNRAISIEAPAEAAAGSTAYVTLRASTDASDREEIGILHADYSADDGQTWNKFYYVENRGAELSYKVGLPVNGRGGGKTLVRVRVAFRGGEAGDVDYQGGAIEWGDSWLHWRTPPTKYAIIYSPKP